MGNSQLNDIPGTRREVVQLGTITANTYPYDGNVETVLLRATDNITIESVRIQYPRTITGNNVNHHTLNIITRTAIYGGATEVANKDFTTGTNASADTTEELWAPTGTAGDLTAGMYLTLQVGLEGTGVAMANPVIIIDWRVQE